MSIIYHLQALRAIAAGIVVLHHARDLARDTFPSLGHIHIGAAGVDLFFILSGMVITLAERGRASDPANFLVRRVVRVVPLYWIALLLVWGLVLAGLSPLGNSAADASPSNLLRSLSFLPYSRESGLIMPLLGVGWTLNFEIFFYAMFAGTLLLPTAYQLSTLSLTLLMLVLAGLVLQPTSPAAILYTHPLLLEFLAGVWLALWWKRRSAETGPRDRIKGWALIFFGLAGFAMSIQPDGFHELASSRVILFGLPALACVIGALLLERGGTAVRSQAWQFAGAASFAVYLFHPQVLQVLDKLVHMFDLVLDQMFVLVGVMIFGVLFSHLTGFWMHICLERPIIRLLRPLVGLQVKPSHPLSSVGFR